jgi:hypothetical protein
MLQVTMRSERLFSQGCDFNLSRVTGVLDATVGIAVPKPVLECPSTEASVIMHEMAERGKNHDLADEPEYRFAETVAVRIDKTATAPRSRIGHRLVASIPVRCGR